MRRLATYYRECGSSDAITLQTQILEKLEGRLGPNDAETLTCRFELAWTYDYVGQYDVSVPMFKHVLEKRRAILGPTHPDTLDNMRALAQNYTHMDRFHESVALHEQILELRESTDDPEWWFLVTYAIACQGARKLDQAAILLHKALAQARRRGASAGPDTAYTLGWLARNLFLQERYAEAEQIARETIALYEKERPYDPEGFYFMSILGAVLCEKKNYDKAEPLLLQGYEGMKRGEALLSAVWKHRMAEPAERVVHFYEVTNQPEKARAWREKLALPAGSMGLWKIDQAQPELLPLPREVMGK